ncbi:MAG: cellulase family glycosylhydrolase [Rikenellaceae bacterium]
MKKLLIWALLLASTATAIASTNGGQNDYVYVENGVLYLPSGKEMKLWGVNLQTPLSWEYNSRLRHVGTPFTAEALRELTDESLDELQRMDVDVVRCHLTPADFTTAKGELVETLYLDMLDYMIAACKERGIYLYITFLNHMGNAYIKESMLNKTDHKEWIISPSIVEKSKTYIEQLLNRKNRYTGGRYKEESAICMWEIINEPRYYKYDEFKASPYAEIYTKWLTESGASDTLEKYFEFRSEKVLGYIDGIYDLIRSTGARQPIVWNCNWHRMVVDCQDVFDVIAQSKVEVVSFCNYPGQNECKDPYWDNPLDHTERDFAQFFRNGHNKYEWYGWALSEPFASKAKVVYEFETFFNSSSYLYSQMARFMRSMGAQAACMWTYCMPNYAPYSMANPSEDEGAGYIISHSRDLAAFASDQIFAYSNSTDAEDLQGALQHTPKRILGRGNSKFAASNSEGRYMIQVMGKELRIYVEPNVRYLREHWQRCSYKDGVAVDVLYDDPCQMSLSIEGWQEDGHYTIQRVEGKKRKKYAKVQSLSSLSLKPGEYVINKN